MAFAPTIFFGPTASGKTARAYALARELGANILSFDSRHIYKDMDIVTGKDLDTSFPGKVFGLDLVTPDQEFSIHHYAEYAAPILAEHEQTKTPLVLVGGSWQYVQTLIQPPDSLSSPVDSQLRDQLAPLSISELQAQLQALNPSRWEIMNTSDRANPRRLVRAIEIALNPECGSDEPPLLPDYKLEILDPPMEEVEEKIRQRVESRWQHGALEETQMLMQKYPDWSGQAFSSTGYMHIRRFLEGEIDETTAKNLWITQERQYAKRQKTWVKSVQKNLFSEE